MMDDYNYAATTGMLNTPITSAGLLGQSDHDYRKAQAEATAATVASWGKQTYCDTSLSDAMYEFHQRELERERERKSKPFTGHADYTFSDGARYIGDWRNNQMHGKGRITYANGNSYKGYFEFHFREGEGKFTFKDGTTFKGRFHQDDLVHGKVSSPNSEFYYIGDVLKGQRHGYGELYQNGKWYQSDTLIFKGNFSNNMAHGYGERDYGAGCHYKGEWENGREHGKGELTYSNGHRYNGEWRNGERHGHAKYTWPNGDYFEGEYRDNHRTNGTFYDAQTRKYFKEVWNGETKVSSEEITRPSQSKAQSSQTSWDDFSHQSASSFGASAKANSTGPDFTDGRRFEWNGPAYELTGFGKIIWPDGTEYSGAISNGFSNGQGTLKLPSGFSYGGEWLAGNFQNGHGEMSWQNGNKYTGNIVDLKMNGFGTHKWPDGWRYKGDWIGNQRDGDGNLYRPDGSVQYEGDWANDKREGFGTLYREDGSIEYQGNFLNDQPVK